MKKNIKWLVLIVILAGISGALWHSYKSDPLAEFKETKVEVLQNHDQLKELMDTALSAIKENDKRALYKLFGGDPMAFNRRYGNGIFKEQDFCPAEIKEYRRLKRNSDEFYQVEVLSTARQKFYLFNVNLTGDGKYMLASIEEKL